jgi:hypothetical protein
MVDFVRQGAQGISPASIFTLHKEVSDEEDYVVSRCSHVCGRF